MQPPVEPLTAWLFTQGVLGVVIVGLLLVIRTLRQDSTACQTVIKELRAENTALQDKRVAESQQFFRDLMAVAQAGQTGMNQMTEAVKALAERRGAR